MHACNWSRCAGHHLLRRAPDAVADAIAAWLQILDSSDPDKCT